MTDDVDSSLETLRNSSVDSRTFKFRHNISRGVIGRKVNKFRGQDSASTD
jgi:hypothetical protein